MLYQFFLEAPFTELITSGQTQAAGQFFGCLTPESVVHLGSAMLDFQAGGYSPQEKSCLVDIYLENPDAMYRWLGMEPPAGLVTTRGDEDSVDYGDRRMSGIRRVDRAAVLFTGSLPSLCGATDAQIGNAVSDVEWRRMTGGRFLAPTIDTSKNPFASLGRLLPEKVRPLILVTGGHGVHWEADSGAAGGARGRGETAGQARAEQPTLGTAGGAFRHWGCNRSRLPESRMRRRRYGGAHCGRHTGKGPRDFPEHQRAGYTECGGGGRKGWCSEDSPSECDRRGPRPQIPIPSVQVGGGGGGDQFKAAARDPAAIAGIRPGGRVHKRAGSNDQGRAGGAVHRVG